ncbi:MAG: GGDEF domain-containing protein [Pseudomonadota bacterium]|nr:GGDEF domain-containing protein [Pseudomonadota bacterium]
MGFINNMMKKLGYVPQSDLNESQAQARALESDLSAARAESYDLHNRMTSMQRELDLSRRDDLTGLGNKKRLDDAYQKLYVDDHLEGHALVMIDANNLKKVNDTLEYDGGNTYLRHIAHSISETFPDHVVMARHGGDEYSIIIKATEEEAQALADQFEAHVQENLCFHMEDDTLYAIEGSAASGVTALHNGMKLGGNGGAIEAATQEMQPHKDAMKAALKESGHEVGMVREATGPEQEQFHAREQELFI